MVSEWVPNGFELPWRTTKEQAGIVDPGMAAGNAVGRCGRVKGRSEKSVLVESCTAGEPQGVEPVTFKRRSRGALRMTPCTLRYSAQAELAGGEHSTLNWVTWNHFSF